MRKFYSLLAFVLMMLPMVASAQTMTTDNAVLDQLGYRLEKDVDFFGGTVNGVAINPADHLEIGDAEAFKLNGQVINKIMNEGLEFMSFQNNSITFAAGTGLKTTKNERWLVFNNLRVGQVLAFDLSNKDTVQFVVNSIACNANTGWADTPSDPLIVEPISGEIHELQELMAEGSADSFRYFKVINEGPLCCKFNGKSAQTMYHMQIWASKDEDEAVTAPIMKITKVQGTDRLIEFKTGESTLGAECKVYYGLGDEQALYTKPTDEIDHYDYTYDPDSGEALDSVPVYKQVIDKELVESAGAYGDREYDGESALIQASDDEDGDGYVIVKFVTVSANGVPSEVVEEKLSVGEIKLNDPVLSLTGFDGDARTYKISWTNNTICKEDYNISYETDGNPVEFETNEGIDAEITATKTVKVTISVDGYTDGVTEMEVDAPGVNIVRKNATEGHDWDFTNLTDEQQKIVRGELIDKCYLTIAKLDGNGNPMVDGNGVAVNDTIYYSAEEFEEGTANDGVTDLSSATPVYKASCWWWDAGNLRATLNVNSDTIVAPSTLHNPNGNGYGYVNDDANIFHGININCAPNNKNASCIFIYINGSLGAYFMARPTLTFSPNVAKAGEYVVINQGQGGSNYVNWQSSSVYEVPAGELLSVTLAGNGIHVFYIDIYTHDGITDGEDLTEKWNETVAIKGTNAAVTPIVGYYSLSGAKLDAPQRGVNVVKYADGATMKVMVK